MTFRRCFEPQRRDRVTKLKAYACASPRNAVAPTESVTYQASVLSVMVVMATPMEVHSNRLGVKKRVGSSDIMLALSCWTWQESPRVVDQVIGETPMRR